MKEIIYTQTLKQEELLWKKHNISCVSLSVKV